MNCKLKDDNARGAQERPCVGNSLFTIYYSPFPPHHSLFSIILLVACHLSLVTALSVATAVGGQGAENAVRYEASHESMGTVFTVAVYGRDRTFLSEVVEEAFEAVDRLDEQMSNYKPQSELSTINRTAASRPVIVEPELFHLLEISVGRSEETDGAFDITVGPLMKSWGFFRGRGRLPTQAEISQVLKGVGYQHLKLDAARRTIRFDAEGVELDLGGIAKGYAVDRAVDVLRSNGITSALVSSGMSSIYALGSPPGSHGWKITLRDPYDAHKAGDVFHLQNYSLSTSGSYEKFLKIAGKNYCHIMNPHTGWPVDNMLSALVLAPTGTDTDGRSAGFFVMGVERTRKYLAVHPNLAAVFYIPNGDPPKYKRVQLRSDSYSIPPDSIVEIDR
jgi:thiamine biosynthesis lipoprotein